MILVDTSVWIDHLRNGNNLLAKLLDGSGVLAHPFVIGELALGNMRQREVILAALSDLPRAGLATDAEALGFINRHAPFGRGVGYVDVHLLASVRLTPGAELWTGTIGFVMSRRSSDLPWRPIAPLRLYGAGAALSVVRGGRKMLEKGKSVLSGAPRGPHDRNIPALRAAIRPHRP